MEARSSRSAGRNHGSSNEVVSVSRRGLVCTYCGLKGIASMSKLLLHIDRMHSVPCTCVICKVEFVDRYSYNQHSPNCFYFCPIEGCNYKDKRESRLKGHLRRHTMK